MIRQEYQQQQNLQHQASKKSQEDMQRQHQQQQILQHAQNQQQHQHLEKLTSYMMSNAVEETKQRNALALYKEQAKFYRVMQEGGFKPEGHHVAAVFAGAAQLAVPASRALATTTDATPSLLLQGIEGDPDATSNQLLQNVKGSDGVVSAPK